MRLKAMRILALSAAAWACQADLSRADVVVLMSSLQSAQGDGAADLAGPLGPAAGVRLVASCQGACRAEGAGLASESGGWTGSGMVKWDGAGTALFKLSAPAARGPVEWRLDGALAEGVKVAKVSEGELALEGSAGAYANLMFSEPQWSAGKVIVSVRELGWAPIVAPGPDSGPNRANVWAAGLALGGFAGVLGVLSLANRRAGQAAQDSARRRQRIG